MNLKITQLKRKIIFQTSKPSFSGSMLIFHGVIGGLGPVVWDSTGNPQESQSRIHFRGSNRNPNHRASKPPIYHCWNHEDDDHNHDDYHSSFIMSRMHFFPLKFARCVQVQDCKPSRSPPFCFFSEMQFFWVRKNRSCSISLSKKAVGSFRPPPCCGHLSWYWSYGLPWGKSHVQKRPPWCRDGTGRGRGRNFFPQGPCCF